MDIIKALAEELKLTVDQVEKTVALLVPCRFYELRELACPETDKRGIHVQLF